MLRGFSPEVPRSSISMRSTCTSSPICTHPGNNKISIILGHKNYYTDALPRMSTLRNRVRDVLASG